MAHKHNRKQMGLLWLLVFIILSISSCKEKTATTSTSLKTSTPTRSSVPITILSESILANSNAVYIGSSKGTLTVLNANTGTVVWQKTLGSRIYIACVENGVVVASNENMVYAFDTKNGNQLWGKRVTSIAGAGVSCTNSIVYIESSVINSYYTVSALSMMYGAQLWQYKAGSFTPDFLGIANGTAYIVEAQSSNPESIDQSLTALQADNGKALWHTRLNNTGGLARAITVAPNGNLYLTTTYGSTIALRSDRGVLLWQHLSKGMLPESVGNTFPLAVTDGVVYVNDIQSTIAFRANDGHILWQRPHSHPITIPIILQPVVDNGTVYTGMLNDPILALRANDGAEIWQNKDVMVAQPLKVQAGIVYVDASNTFYALHTQDGREVWRQAIQYPDGSGPAVHEAIKDENVIVGQTNGKVQTFNAITGTLRWSRIL